MTGLMVRLSTACLTSPLQLGSVIFQHQLAGRFNRFPSGRSRAFPAVRQIERENPDYDQGAFASPFHSAIKEAA